jgi:hypothetical protein
LRLGRSNEHLEVVTQGEVSFRWCFEEKQLIDVKKKRSNGMCTVLRQTIRKRLQAKLNEVKAELQRRMHEPIPEQGKWLQSVVRGHLRYYGVPMNHPALALFASKWDATYAVAA